MATALKRDKKQIVKSRKTVDAKRKALVESLCGSLSWVDCSVDQYLREKREEVERENRR